MIEKKPREAHFYINPFIGKGEKGIFGKYNVVKSSAIENLQGIFYFSGNVFISCWLGTREPEG